MRHSRTVRRRSSKSLRRIAALAVLTVSLASLLGLSFLARSSAPAPEPRPGAAISVEPGSAGRASSIREFETRHRRDIGARVDGLIERDPTYSAGINRVSAEHVESLEGFSPEEKKVLWESVRAAQERARRATRDANRRTTP